MGEQNKSMREIVDHYHHCATCQHFGFRAEENKKYPMCTRLGFDTKPEYQFDCWDPKPRVRAAIQKKLLNQNKMSS